MKCLSVCVLCVCVSYFLCVFCLIYFHSFE
jgi:hypothetical protein